jgi:ionotropic glutamate receptor
MSLNDSLDAVARAKLAVWDYPVSEQFTKLISRMHVPNTTSEAMEMVRRGELALIGKTIHCNFVTYVCIFS